MTPNLQPRSKAIVWKFYPKRFLRRGQIVIIDICSHQYYEMGIALERNNCLIIKRIVGLPGDKVIGLDKEIYQEQSWEIGSNYCFVLSDNSDARADSRQLGPISLDALRGVVIYQII